MAVIPPNLTYDIGNGITGPMGSVISASNISNTSWTQPEYAIQGKMLSVSMTVSDYEWSTRPQDPMEIKLKLMNLLAEKMMADKHIEFTKVHDTFTGDQRFNARIFVVQDTQVRIIRERGLAK
jgi:hypothetical protein